MRWNLKSLNEAFFWRGADHIFEMIFILHDLGTGADAYRKHLIPGVGENLFLILKILITLISVNYYDVLEFLRWKDLGNLLVKCLHFIGEKAGLEFAHVFIVD